MFGIEIKAKGKSKSQLIKILKEAIEEIENNHTSIHILLNDEDNTECFFDVVKIGDLDISENWLGCPTVTHEEWAGEDSDGEKISEHRSA